MGEAWCIIPRDKRFGVYEYHKGINEYLVNVAGTQIPVIFPLSLSRAKLSSQFTHDGFIAECEVPEDVQVVEYRNGTVGVTKFNLLEFYDMTEVEDMSRFGVGFVGRIPLLAIKYDNWEGLERFSEDREYRYLFDPAEILPQFVREGDVKVIDRLFALFEQAFANHSYYISFLATKYGQPSVLDWWCANVPNEGLNEYVIAIACNNVDVEILGWWEAHFPEKFRGYHGDIIDLAIDHGHLEILEWCFETFPEDFPKSHMEILGRMVKKDFMRMSEWWVEHFSGEFSKIRIGGDESAFTRRILREQQC